MHERAELLLEVALQLHAFQGGVVVLLDCIQILWMCIQVEVQFHQYEINGLDFLELAIKLGGQLIIQCEPSFL